MRFSLTAVVLVALAAAGCSEDRTYDVKGTVTIGGAAVPAGVIWFEPDITKGNTTGPQGYAQIKDGKFDTRADGRGIRPGAYTIRVEAFDGRPANELPFGKPLLNPPYETARDFPAEATEITIDVPAPPVRKR
jgi:hypothetical protein